MSRFLFLSAGLLFLVGIQALSQIVNPRITTDNSIDLSSAQAVVAQIIRPGMTDEEKVVACWRFMLDHYYHWYPPREDDVYQDVRDFAKNLNSYGFGPCFVNAPVLTALWEAAGYETRCWTINGHTIPEVRYGGAWHMLDADARAWHRKADGEIASVDELSKDATLFTAPKEKSDPYYPFAPPDVVAKPLDPWGPPSRLMDLYLSRNDNVPFNRRAVMGHPMHLILRQGEMITLNYENEGKWYKFAGLPDSALATGPVEINRRFTYGNGHLIWRPDLGRASAEEILWLGSHNIRCRNARLECENEAAPAVAVFRVWSPYVIVEAKGILTLIGDPSKARFEISNDGGYGWFELTAAAWTDRAGDSREGAFDFTGRVVGRYEYLLRVTFEKGALTGVSFDTVFQVSQLSFPRLKPGRNRVKIFRGPDEGHVQLVLGPGRVAKERYLVESKGMDVPKNLTPAKYGEPAYAIYRLVAPAPIVAASLGANLTFDPAPDQLIALSYSMDAGQTWSEVFRLTENANRQHSQFEMDKYVKFENPTDSRELLVRFDMRRNSKYFGSQAVRFYAFYKKSQPGNARLGVELAWVEKQGEKWGAEKTKSFTVSTFPTEVEIECTGDTARFSRITMRALP
ncbi:MAG: hypothetical protein N2255_07475 [Kiritimatiellae bacterium]|nr:hypothetical protein [Kiritimatiellia bacterium]